VILSIDQLSDLSYILLTPYFFIASASKFVEEDVQNHPSPKEGVSRGRPSFIVVDSQVLPYPFKELDFSICLVKVPVYFLAVSYLDHIFFVPFALIDKD
jgi:hypothetical protein